MEMYMRIGKKIALVLAVVVGATVNSAHALDAKSFKGNYAVTMQELAGTLYRADAGLVNPPRVAISKTGKITGTWTTFVNFAATGTVKVTGSISKISKTRFGQKGTFSFKLSNGVSVKGSLVYTQSSSATFTGTAKAPSGASVQAIGVRTF
jgi:hypothetical protein